jgi:RNA polymerase sigma-70 factor (ECF subfamily)
MNTAVDALRARRATVPIDADACAALAAEGSPETDYERQVVADEVRGALDRLSPKLRAAVVSRYVLGLDYEEIADALGVSPGTVASRLSRARAALAGQLGRLRAWGSP